MTINKNIILQKHKYTLTHPNKIVDNQSDKIGIQ